MKRLIPICIVLAAAVAAGIYYYPRLMKKPASANELTISGNIEAHESLVGFKVEGRIVKLPVEEGSKWSRAHCWRGLKMPTTSRTCTLKRPACGCANPTLRSHLPEPASRM